MAERKKRDSNQTTVFEKEPPFPERAQSLEESRRGDTRQPEVKEEVKPEVVKEEIKPEVVKEKVKIKREPNPNNILVKAKLLKEENEKLKAELYNKQLKTVSEDDSIIKKNPSIQIPERNETPIKQLDTPAIPKLQSKRVDFNTLDNARQKQILRLLGRF